MKRAINNVTAVHPLKEVLEGKNSLSNGKNTIKLFP